MGFLASVSAGVTEEILFRLGLMTSLAWLLTVLTRRSAAGPVIVLVANVLAALAFAAAHLPQAKAFYGLSTLMVLVVMIGNGVPGVIFGWLFRRETRTHHGDGCPLRSAGCRLACHRANDRLARTTPVTGRRTSYEPGP